MELIRCFLRKMHILRDFYDLYRTPHRGIGISDRRRCFRCAGISIFGGGGKFAPLQKVLFRFANKVERTGNGYQVFARNRA